MDLDPKTRRFYGRSSDISMINMTLRLQSETLSDLHPELEAPVKRPVFWQPMQVKAEVDLGRQVVLVFPEPDLMYSLIDLYFDKVNYLIPTLHKPTFFRLVEDGVHHKDIMFGALVLAACALGAAAGSDDPRMIAPDAELPVARGLDYVRQIWQIRKGLIAPCSLYEIQLLCTISHIHYAGEGIFTMIGTGVRYMQELGVHRMNGTSRTSVEGELWRRAFWTFLIMDRIIASMTGRPCCVQDEDHDLEWPREVDDEYWEDPIHPWKQPADKPPSNVQFFTQYIKLCNIEGNAQRTIYANKKPRVFRNLKDEEWQKRVILELDSELNHFQVELPAHLRWDPKVTPIQPPHLLLQAGSLNAYFHFVRIQIHRPFVMNQGPIIGPSLPLLISTNAAHSVCNTLDAISRAGCIVNPVFQNTSICAGVMLLLNMWSSMRYRRSIDWAKEMGYVDRVMGAMKNAESRWAPAGQIWDLLNGLRWCPMNETELTNRGEQLQRCKQAVKRPVVPQPSPAQAFQYEQTSYGREHPIYSDYDSPQTVPPQASSRAHSPPPTHNGGYYRQAAQPTHYSSHGHAPSASSAAPYQHTGGRHLAPLHLTQPTYYAQQPVAGHDIPTYFGGLDESLLLDIPQQWDLGAYHLTYPEYNHYGQQAYQAETHDMPQQQHQYSVSHERMSQPDPTWASNGHSTQAYYEGSEHGFRH
ncbi:fungal-specific transcription factor domain-containing protein [Pterulicium gracile]|uniref:Fungal-specific transcription factor domain-containing protein n=1 Tax=Pterulicium gracile TaxID=1884261 RepID=A0A5C3QFZ0_9AGAR|nr:fungal-specific transcription factor domain-containing protein [Pterula gracilis]